jgi:NAD(P)-dependent dehydrogenase (short-subunit alcohol dehydrogenase family)
VSECVIVTGGAYEEGLSVAEGLLRAGCDVSIWDDRAESLDKAVAELEGLGLSAHSQEVDVADLEQVRAAHAAVCADLGRPRALFNMATLRSTFMLGEPDERSKTPPPFWELDMGKLSRAIHVNVIGTIHCTSVVAPDMVAAGDGSIVNFTTGFETQRSPHNIPYGPTKAMVEAFSDGASKTLAPLGVRLNVICSGGGVNRRGEHRPDRVPADWSFALAGYLAGDESKGVTGQLFEGSGLTPLRPLADGPAPRRGGAS